MNPLGFAGLGALGGGMASMAGDLLAGASLPRELLWKMIPGLHDPATGEARTGEQVMDYLLGQLGVEGEPADFGPPLSGTMAGGLPETAEPPEAGIRSGLRSPLARVLGAALDIGLDPLTFGVGPLAGLAGGKLGGLVGEASATARLANRAGRAALETAPALDDAARLASQAAAAVPDFSKVVGVGGRGYPTDAVRNALSSGNLGQRGLGQLGSVIRRPPSQFLVDQLERQGMGSSILNEAGEVSDRFLLSSDPKVRELFAPRGGHLRQLAEVDPAFRGPLTPLFYDQPPMPTMASLGGPVLDPAHRSPILRHLVDEAGALAPEGVDAGGYLGLMHTPVSEGAGLMARAAGETREGMEAIGENLRAMPLARLFARLTGGNPLGV